MVVLVTLGIFLNFSMGLCMGLHHELAVESFAADVTTEYLLQRPILKRLLFLFLIIIWGYRLGS